MANLQRAKEQITFEIGLIVKESSIYETEAWGKKDQPSFLNQVVIVKTPSNAPEIMETILQIEQDMGRRRMSKYDPRIIDIDILFYNNDQILTDRLIVPHPEIQNRKFVLIPLNEIAPDYIHPVFNKTIRQLLKECTDPLQVNKFN